MIPAVTADYRGDGAPQTASSTPVIGPKREGELIASLMAADLIEEYLLMILPLVLGSGRRLFPQHGHVTLRLIDRVTTPTGMVIATYEPAED